MRYASIFSSVSVAAVILATTLSSSSVVTGFVPTTTTKRSTTTTTTAPYTNSIQIVSKNTKQQKINSRLEVAPILEDIESARTAFFIWFFGASGAAGIARSSFPKLYTAYQKVQALAGVGPTLGGKTLGISPLTGYPQDLSIKDVEKVVNNKLTVTQIVDKYPVDGNFWSTKGYLTYDAFCLANKGANPLAVRAVFDTFATSTNVVEPNKAQDMLDSYKVNVMKVKDKLLFAKAVGFSAFFFLLFLLGFADVVAFGHAYKGWFPEWPGGQNFPACLLDKETGPWTIPNYWI